MEKLGHMRFSNGSQAADAMKRNGYALRFLCTVLPTGILSQRITYAQAKTLAQSVERGQASVFAETYHDDKDNYTLVIGLKDLQGNLTLL